MMTWAVMRKKMEIDRVKTAVRAEAWVTQSWETRSKMLSVGILRDWKLLTRWSRDELVKKRGSLTGG